MPATLLARPDLAAEPRGAYDGRVPRAPTGDPTCEQVAAAVAVLAAAVEKGALEGLDPTALRGRFDTFRRLEGIATAGQARTTGLLARSGQLRAEGASSTGGWLQQAANRSTRDAARLARLASRLDDLPETADAVATGQITAEAADAIVRAVDDGRLGQPAHVERSLAGLARRATPEKLRREVRRRTQAADGAAMLRDERRQHAARRLAIVDRPDGLADITGQLPGEQAERLRTCLDALDRPDDSSVPPGRRRTHAQRLADALDVAVTQLLARGDGLAATGGRVPQVTVTVDLATVQADLADPERTDRPVAPDDAVWAGLPAGTTEWGRTLSPQAVRRLLCDAAVTRVVTAGGSLPVDLGRSTRTFTPGQRRAITARDGGCRGPGCDRPPGWTQVHHVQWWSAGGSTDVGNGLLLCHACHRLVHDDGWTVTLDHATGHVRWTAPDGTTTVVHARRTG